MIHRVMGSLMGAGQKFDILHSRSTYKAIEYSEAVAMLSSGMINFAAQAKHPNQSKWCNILSYSNFGSFVIRQLKVAAHAHSYDSLFNHWYVNGNLGNYGPFSLLQMLEFYNQNRIDLDTLVRHPSQNQWERFDTCGPFEVRSLENLISNSEVKFIITRRKYPRIKYDNEVFLSGAGELYRGVSWSLSSGGLGIVTDESTNLQLNDRLNVIINSNNDHGAVQLKGRVVNLKKEMNCERVALEFEGSNEFIEQFIDDRVPSITVV